VITFKEKLEFLTQIKAGFMLSKLMLI